MFGLIFTSLITFSHLYFFWRAASVPFVRKHFSVKAWTVVAISLWLLFVAGLFYGHWQDDLMAQWLELAGMTWMGILFLLVTSFLAVEVVTGGGCFFSPLARTLRGAALATGLVLSAIAIHQGTSPPTVSEFAVTLPGLPPVLDGKVLLAVSDLHLGSLRREKWLADRISQIEALHPDMVLMVGDIFEGHGGSKLQRPLVEMMRELKAPLGVWGVPGNHEFYGGPQTIKALENGGVRLLRNSWAEAQPGLVLAGVEDHSFSRRPEDGADLTVKALTGKPPGAVILLSHKPWRAEEAAQSGVGLMLSGHTHDGQIWPFNYLVGHFFPLLAGRYEVGSMSVLVCRGTGSWGAPMRLWRPGEILRITIRADH